jgi:gliding motility-associated-like protein
MKWLYVIGMFLSGLFFLQTSIQAQQGNCPNLNFSYANFNYWQAYVGSCGSGIKIDPSAATPGRHTIMDAAQLMMTGQMQDENCIVIPKVPTGFNYSARLGNSVTGAEMEALEYTMTVDSTNSLLILHFAWAMEDPSHEPADQPQFTMTIRDSLGRTMTNLPCGYVNFIADQNLEGLKCQTSSFLARDWTTVGFSLEGLMGQTIKIYFETRDCTQSGHYGYAYIVGECRPMAIDLMYCEGQAAARMRAPDGFVWYKWTRSRQPNWKREGAGRQFQNIVVDDPIDGEEFICQVTSELGANCSATLRTVVAKTTIDADFIYGIKNEKGHVPIMEHGYESWYDTCNRTATFVDLSSIRNSAKESILWEIPALGAGSTDSMFTYTFPDPETNKPDTYLIRLTVFAENGCVDTSKGRIDHKITIYPSPRVEIVGEDQICEGDSTWLSVVEVRSKYVSHTWTWKDSTGTHTKTGDSLMIYKPGTYYMLSQDSAGCFARDTFMVTTLRPIFNIPFIQHVNCYGEKTGQFSHGAISGGIPPYDPFYWILFDKDGNDSIVPANIQGTSFMNLVAEVYKFEAIDKRGCAIRGEVTIKQNDSLKIKGTQMPTTCGLDNGTLKLMATGGVPPYKYEIRKEDGTLASSSDTASNLSTGCYTIQVTDAVKCVTSDTISVEPTPVPRILLLESSMETCESANGSIRVTPKDAVFPLRFTWSTGKEKDTTNMVSNLKTGTYTVTMVDGNGCQSKLDIVVDSYPTPIVTIAKTPETCERRDGTITLTVNSKSPETLKYIWEGRSDTSDALTGLKADRYIVTISDAICVVEDTIEIVHVDGPVANFESNSYNVPSNTIFTLTDISQGTVKTWNWDMGDEETQTGKIVYYTYGKSGDYLVFLEVIDENGCIDTISKVIHVYEELNVYIPNMFTPNNDPYNNTWKPIMSEYSKEGYQLSIFDRWGSRIFHTTNTEDSWDGMVNGKHVAPNSVYSYRVIVRDFTGQEYEFVGQVTVLK